MQVLVLVAVIRDSLLKKSKSHTYVVRSLKSPASKMSTFPRPARRKDGKNKVKEMSECFNFFASYPISLPLSRLILIHSLHQYLSAYTHMPTNSLILKREHIRRWVTMFFTSEFSTTQTFLTPLIMPTPMPAEDEDETKSQSSAPAFLPSVHQHRRTSLNIYIDEQQRISSLDRNLLPR